MVALLVSEGVVSPQHQKLVRGVCLDSIFKRGWMKGGQCLPRSRRCFSRTPPQWEITTRSGGPRCRMGVSLVSPRGTTLSSCHPARLWSFSSHDQTTELLASPGWALTAASCSLMLCCPSAVGFSEQLSALRAPQWSKLVALERSRARCSLHPVCGCAWTLWITLHRQLV